MISNILKILSLLCCVFLANTANAAPPSGVVTIVNNSWNLPQGNFTAIPRYKLWIESNNPNNIWAIFGGDGSVPDSYRSTDMGNTWSPFGTNTWDYHASLWGDTSNNLHVGSRTSASGIAMYRRYTGSWQPIIQFDDFGGAASTANVIASGSDVFLITRSSFGGSPQAVLWHRSTNGGASFSAAQIVTPVSDGVWHRIGSIMVSGKPTVVVWDTEASYCTIKLFRWNGTSFVALANNTLQIVSNNPMTRQYALTETTDGTIHAVWQDIISGNNVLRHSYRTLTGTWSAATTIGPALDVTLPEQILTHQGNTVYMAYKLNSGGYVGVWYRTWTASSGWSSATQLSTAAGGSVNNLNTAPEIPANANYFPVMYQTGSGPFSVRFVTANISAPPSTLSTPKNLRIVPN